jgi:hypothetical protein
MYCVCIDSLVDRAIQLVHGNGRFAIFVIKFRDAIRQPIVTFDIPSQLLRVTARDPNPESAEYIAMEKSYRGDRAPDDSATPSSGAEARTAQRTSISPHWRR